jgi:thiosulfate sulfurtransferase
MPSFQHISPSQARALLDTGAPTIVDIRDPAVYAQEHIAGAVQLGQHNAAEFIAAADKATPLIVYCYHGISSQGAAQFFVEQGFAEVYSLDGGYEGWRS